VRLIQRVYPQLEVHGSTQMTVHDPSGALVMQRLGVERVVLARENTLDDIRAIREAVPALGLETFVHGALCIAYSGQCYMSGMISERSANRGSCAQSCRKDYVLTDVVNGAELDRGYLISARDLAAHDHLAAIAELGVGCLKVEGRKKKPEFVATVTRGYRTWLDRVAKGDVAPPPTEEVQPLVQIFSRGNTGGMYGGRIGRDYVTRTQPDNRGITLGAVVGREGHELIVEVNAPLHDGDGVGFEPPMEGASATTGCTVQGVRTVTLRGGVYRQAFQARVRGDAGWRAVRAEAGWRVVRTSDSALLESARETFAQVAVPDRTGLVRLDVRCFGQPGAPLKLVITDGTHTVTVRSEMPLAPASKRALDVAQLREQLGRLGETEFVLGAVQVEGLAEGCFLPVSELNRLRQQAVSELQERRQWDGVASAAERDAAIAAAVAEVPVGEAPREVDVEPVSGALFGSGPDVSESGPSFRLVASVWTVDDALAAAEAGATEVVLDPFLRHPAPSLSKVQGLRESLAQRGVTLRLRTPTIVRPEDRKRLDK
jgi:putative protease